MEGTGVVSLCRILTAAIQRKRAGVAADPSLLVLLIGPASLGLPSEC
jgi:hypothetical protein